MLQSRHRELLYVCLARTCGEEVVVVVVEGGGGGGVTADSERATCLTLDELFGLS